MATPSLPIEIQLLILTLVFVGTPAFDPVYWELFPENLNPAYNFPLATTFFAARTFAPPPPPTAGSIPGTASLPVRPIGQINDPLVLRTALAAALPAWRGALRGIPALWTRIAIPIDKETWSKDVLSAVQEALECANGSGEPLDVLITHSPVESEMESANNPEAERTRVLQIMRLLAPHMTRLRYLRICTLYPVALPVPTIDFVGHAPLLGEMYLQAVLPASSTAIATLPGEAGALDMPLLHTLSMDVHTFGAVYLHKGDMLPAVEALTLLGSGIEDGESSSPMSVKTLLVCTAQMDSLEVLRLDGVQLKVRQEGEGEPARRSIPLRHLTTLYCRRLSSAMLGKVLQLSSESPGDNEEEEGRVRNELEIAECGLPVVPGLGRWKYIYLHDIGPGEDVASFLAYAGNWCTSLVVDRCADFPLGSLFLLPRLRHLALYRCPEVEAEALQETMSQREWVTTIEDIDPLHDVTLDGQQIYLPESEGILRRVNRQN